MKDANCIFCKIAGGEIPSATIYEDDTFRVILDLGPANHGHALILPKEHYANLPELDTAVAEKVMPLAAKIGTALQKALGCDGFNVLQNNGRAAGQSVFHFHVHVIPRYDNDGKIPTWVPGSYAEGELEAVAEKIREAF